MRQIIIFLLSLSLFGCSHFHAYRPGIEQGNIMTIEMVNQLHVGMTQKQVENIMGEPILKDTFHDNRVNYVYTFKSKKGKISKKRVTLIFRNGKVIKIEKALNNKSSTKR